MSKDPKKEVNATIDFLEAVVTGHWVACACDILGIANPRDEISMPAGLKKATASEQLLFVEGIARKVVDRLSLVDSFCTGG